VSQRKYVTNPQASHLPGLKSVFLNLTIRRSHLIEDSISEVCVYYWIHLMPF